LREILPTVITVTKTTTPKQIINAMALLHQVAMSYQAAKKAKSFVLGTIYNNKATSSGFFPRTSTPSVIESMYLRTGDDRHTFSLDNSHLSCQSGEYWWSYILLSCRNW
jgi:hypothetical protein